MQNGLIVAHFNRSELGNMDKLQGGRIRDPKTGLPVYSRLGHMIENHPAMKTHLDEIFELGNMHKAGHETHLSKHLKEMAHHGRFGDTELAEIPHTLSEKLDHMIGGPSFNPKDGKKEYFLGALASLAMPLVGTLVDKVGDWIGGGSSEPAAPPVITQLPERGSVYNPYTNSTAHYGGAGYIPDKGAGYNRVMSTGQQAHQMQQAQNRASGNPTTGFANSAYNRPLGYGY